MGRNFYFNVKLFCKYVSCIENMFTVLRGSSIVVETRVSLKHSKKHLHPTATFTSWVTASTKNVVPEDVTTVDMKINCTTPCPRRP